MTDEHATARDASAGGLAWILGATVIAGAIGYAIQAAVPAFLDPREYVAFSVFWSVVYLVVSGLSGIQQEVTRASHSGTAGTDWHTLARFTAVCAGAVAAIVGVTAPFWAPSVFASEAIPLVGALLVAAVGYALIANISGALYGVRDWRGVAGMTVTDAGLRLLAVAVALFAGWHVAGLGWAVAVPFVTAAVIVWLATGRKIRRGLSLDAGLRGLLRNTGHTVAAAIATGVMISGLPFLLGLTSTNLDSSSLASLILVITLTRAPLVVPILALQSYLVVIFRDDPSRVRRRLAVWGTGLIAATALLAALAIMVGPWLLGLLYEERYEIASALYGPIVFSAGLTGLLCVTGPAVLASGRHTSYVLGWASASAVTTVLLFLPYGQLDRVIVALMAGPVVGAWIHLAALFRRTISAGA